MNNSIRLLLTLLLVGLTTLVAQAQSKSPQMVAAKGKVYRETFDLPGASVTGYETTSVKAKLGGYVKKIGQVDGEQVDIGMRIKKDTLLLELDVPEMANEIAEKQALVEQAKSAVLQAQAVVQEAEAQVLQRSAEAEQARAKKAEKEALIQFNQIKYQRLAAMQKKGAVGSESVDEAVYSLNAAKASLAAIAADIKAAETNIEAAKAGVRRTKADVANANANVKVAQAALAHSRTMARYATLKAPFDGLITHRGVDHGDYVVSADKNSAAMPLFELTQTDRIRVAVGVPTVKAAKVAVGQKAVFHGIGGMAGRQFIGKVKRTAGVLDAKTRSLRIEVDFTNPVKDAKTGEDVELQPGLFGTLTIVRHEWNKENPIPVVPVSAAGTDAGRSFVVVQQDGKLTRRYVDVAFNDAVEVGIGRGISVGDRVVAKNPSAY